MEKKKISEAIEETKKIIIKYVKNIEKHLSKKTNIENYVDDYWEKHGGYFLNFADDFSEYIDSSGIFNTEFETYEDACKYLKKNDPTLKNALHLFSCPPDELDSKIIASVLSGQEDYNKFYCFYGVNELQKIIDNFVKENIPMEELVEWI